MTKKMYTPEKFVAEYQCTGCVHGPSPRKCTEYVATRKGCDRHQAATHVLSVGRIALGLPKGFDRFGPCDYSQRVDVYDSYEALAACDPNMLTMFCVPVWKHLDEHGNTVLRWYSPRTNYGWSCVVVGNCMDKFPNAREITAADMANMD